MAIVNKGFPGTVNATEYAKSWHLGGSDACDGTGWLVSQGTGRQTSTAAGDAFAAGVLSENSAPILTSLSTPTNGQWFLIVRRVDWAGAGTVTVAAVAHSTTSTTIPTIPPTGFPTINDDPGVTYDHKLAWAWVRSTDTTMVLFDLRELPLEPRLQVIEGGAGRATGAVYPVADPAALNALSTAVIGDVAQVTLPGTGVDPIVFTAVAGSSSDIDWRSLGTIYASTKANLDTATTTITGIADIVMRAGDRAYAADTTVTYRWNGSAWVPWESAFMTVTPTLTNVTLGTGGVSQFRYKYAGDILFFELYVKLGTGGVLTGAPSVTFPVSHRALDHPNEQLFVGGSYYDTSAGSVFPVQMRMSSASVTIALLQNPTVAVNATSPFTWAVDDVISIKGSYRPA